jgi:hypothetical protein
MFDLPLPALLPSPPYAVSLVRILVSDCFATHLVRRELWVWPLWLLFALTNDLLTGWLAQKRLRENFRLWATPSFGEVLGFWGRLGRFLGRLRRRWRTSPRTAA